MIGKSPVDHRGRHIKQAFSEETRLHIRQHIESFPNKESHYLGKSICYLDANLNVKTMYRVFKENYPLIKVDETKYFNDFKENQNLSFESPQVDMLHLRRTQFKVKKSSSQ